MTWERLMLLCLAEKQQKNFQMQARQGTVERGVGYGWLSSCTVAPAAFWKSPIYVKDGRGERALNHVFLSIWMWFEAFNRFHDDFRVLRWPCHCDMIWPQFLSQAQSTGVCAAWGVEWRPGDQGPVDLEAPFQSFQISHVKVAEDLKHLCFFSVKINISTTGGFRVGFFQPDTNHP